MPETRRLADARPADYGLEQPTTKATLVWADPDEPKTKKTRTIEFGIEIPGTDIVAAREAGSSTVLFVPSSALQAVKKGADEFRAREVFGDSDVARLEILRGRGRLVLARKGGTWWLEEPMADLADASEVDRLVGQLTALRVRDFIGMGDVPVVPGSAARCCGRGWMRGRFTATPGWPGRGNGSRPGIREPAARAYRACHWRSAAARR